MAVCALGIRWVYKSPRPRSSFSTTHWAFRALQKKDIFANLMSCLFSASRKDKQLRTVFFSQKQPYQKRIYNSWMRPQPLPCSGSPWCQSMFRHPGNAKKKPGPLHVSARIYIRQFSNCAFVTTNLPRHRSYLSASPLPKAWYINLLVPALLYSPTHRALGH